MKHTIPSKHFDFDQRRKRQVKLQDRIIFPESDRRFESLQSSWKAQHSLEDFPGTCPGLRLFFWTKKLRFRSFALRFGKGLWIW